MEGKSKYIRKVFRDFDENFDGTASSMGVIMTDMPNHATARILQAR